MYVIPAVDIMGGRVVRLLRGDPKLAKSYEHLGDPIELAKRWESDGAQIIHVIDLDATLGSGENLETIIRIIQSVRVPVQVGGGIRSLERAERLINAGAGRIMLGSLAFKSPESVRFLLKKFGQEKIVVALDHLKGKVMVDGWRKSTYKNLEEAAEMFSAMGVKFFLVTAIQRDGTMSGPDVENLSRVVGLGVNVIASGGIRSLKDIEALRKLGVYGVVVGRALYEGRISLKEALKIASNKMVR